MVTYEVSEQGSCDSLRLYRARANNLENNCPVAQLVVQLALNQKVGRSSRPGTAIIAL